MLQTFSITRALTLCINKTKESMSDRFEMNVKLELFVKDFL